MSSPPTTGSLPSKRKAKFEGHVPLKKRPKLLYEATQLSDMGGSDENSRTSFSDSIDSIKMRSSPSCNKEENRPSHGGKDKYIRPSHDGKGDNAIPSHGGQGDDVRPSHGGQGGDARPSYGGQSKDTRPSHGGDKQTEMLEILPISPPTMQPPPTKNSNVTQVANEFLITNKAEPVYSSFAAKMMAKMGHKKGEGLGKHGQGRVSIIEASMQRGRRGLGLKIKAFEPSDVSWDYSKENITGIQTINWMEPCTEEIPDIETLRTWIVEGPRKHTLQDDYEFCNEKLVDDVFKCKSVFDELEPEEMRRARTRSNPYETIRGVFFLNRAAMKMANMDAVADFMFSDPRRADGQSLVESGELLYFADVCAGPGGFSEYILWRRRCEAKGFGFTLKGSQDFKLEDFFAAPSECFEPHYGVGGLDGDGNIYRPDNLRAFRKYVMENTGDKGVHFVMADGGFDVDGREGDQEWLSKRLYLCECAAALSILRTGGHFVCKLFDVFLVYSVGLIHLMYLAFEQVAIFKPVTSRPANSERYLICKGLRPGAHVIHDFLFEANLRFNELGETAATDINEIVPVSVLSTKQQFVEYIVTSNEAFGLKQAIALSKIKAFAQNPQLYESRQAEMREECLHIWKIPDQARTTPNKSMKPFDKFKALMQNKDMEMFRCQPERLTPDKLESHIKSIYNYRCYLATERRLFLLGLGRSYVFQWDGQPGSRWQKVEDANLELPPDTLIEAEFVHELRGEGKGQRRVMAVHFLDAIVLGGKDVQELPFNERLDKLSKFTKAITRHTRGDLAPIRLKEIHHLYELEDVCSRLTMRVVKGSGGQKRLCYCPRTATSEYMPTGIHFVKIVREPWMIAFSQRSNRTYHFNAATGSSIFDVPKEATAPYRYSHKQLLLWAWGAGVKMHESQTTSDPDMLSRQTMLNFIKAHTHL